MLNLPNVPTDQNQIIFSTIDNPYFDAGKTPLYMYLSLSGVSVGDLWYSIPYPYPPPSGFWKLTHRDINTWDFTIEDYFFAIYNYVAPYWRMVVGFITGGLPDYVFLNRSTDWPYHSDDNMFLSSAGLFYGGFCSVQWQPPTGPAGILDIADKIAINPSNRTYITPVSQSSTETIYRYCRRKDSTNIKVKVNKHI